MIPASSDLSLDPSDPAYKSLAQGEELEVAVDYTVTDGIASTAARAIFTINAPQVALPGASAEPGEVEAETLLAVATAGAAAVNLPFDASSLPAGVTYAAAAHSFSIDPSNAAYQSLAAGQTRTVAIKYGVSDGITTTAAELDFVVTGTNDIPVVSGPAEMTVHEDGAVGTFDHAALVAHATDVDLADKLDVQVDDADLPAGVVYHQVPGYTTSVGISTTYYGAITTYVDVQVAPVDTLTIEPSNAAYQSLAQGETLDVVVPYRITDGIASVPAQAIFHMIGTNDAPIVSGPATGAATEDGAPVTINGIAKATDVDHGSVLTVVAAPPPPAAGEVNLSSAGINGTPTAPPPPIVAFDPATLPVGVSFDAATNSFTIDPTNAAFQSLSAGQTKTVTINYGISDGLVAVPASAVFTVTGTNDAPVVTGSLAYGVTAVAAGAAAPVVTLADLSKQNRGTMPDSIEQSLSDSGVAPSVIANSIYMLSNAADIDALDTLKVANLGPLPVGITHIQTPGYYTPSTVYYGAPIYHPGVDLLTIDPSNPAFRSLAAGEVGTYTVDYDVTDGIAVAHSSATFTVTGVNDAPVVSSPVASGVEDGAAITLDLLSTASDPDHGSVLSVASVDAALPGGVIHNAATHTLTLDPTNAAFQSLAQGQVGTYAVGFNVTDGVASTPATAIFSVVGVNDAPVVVGAVSGGTFTASSTAAPISVNLLGNATDIDHLDVLSVNQSSGNQVTATVTSGNWSVPIAFSVANNQLTLDPKQFANLPNGNTLRLTFNYQVTDGHAGGTVADTANVAIVGTYVPPAPPTGVAASPVPGQVAKAQGGSAINAKVAVATFTQVGGPAADAYTYSLGGTGAGTSFTLATSAGVATLSSGNSGAVGASGGQLYALNVTATDVTTGLLSQAAPVDVVVGLGKGSNTINLASIPLIVPSAPTFIYDLGGSDTINATGMTGKLFISSGQGADTITGGSGVNDYLYGSTNDSSLTAMDIITNFHAALDILDFTGLGGKPLTVGALASNATSIGANAIGWQTSGGNTFVYVNTSGNSAALTSASMKIELLGAIPLTSANIAHL